MGLEMRLTALAILISLIFNSAASAQDNGPVVIPERLQQMAMTFPIAQRLGIDWNKASTDDIARYLGFLASTSVVAREIAKRNDRNVSTDDDFLAALTIQCIFPPNKPPFIEKYWPAQIAAFYNAGVRNALRKAVGPVASDIPETIEKYGQKQFAAKGGFLPLKEEEYFDKVFDPRLLPGVP